jgi:lycopene cyclase domain-containing protein
MATYIILNILFMITVFLALGFKVVLPIRRYLIVGLSLIIMTAVFDSALVHFDIIAYTHSMISGIRIGYAPIEDFAYPILATLIIPFVWERLGRVSK